MKTYSQFRPTPFDVRGLGLENRQDWLVAPVSHNRDSEHLDESNFAAALKALGGESETVEVHRFGHWGPGWFEIIIIDPADESRVKIAEDIEAALEDYPVLDEEDWSRREYESYTDSWQHWAGSDFGRELQRTLKLSDAATDVITDAAPEAQMEFFESLIPSGDYWDSDGSPRIRLAVERATRDSVAGFIRANRRK